MEQGFSQGFSVPTARAAGSAEEIAAATIARAARGGKVPHARGRGHSTGELANKTTSVVTQQAHQLDADQERIQKLQSVKSKLMFPTMLEFFGLIGGMTLTWVTEKFNWGRVTTGVRAVLTAPVDALRKTSLAEIFQLPANYMKSVGEHAAQTRDAKAGGKTAAWAKGAEKKANSLSESAVGYEKAVAEKTAGMRGAIVERLDRAQQGGIGKTVHGWLDGVRDTRLNAASTRHGKAMEQTLHAVTTEAVSFFDRIKNWVSNAKPVTKDAGVFAPIMSDLQAAHGITDAAKKAEHLKDVSEALEKIIKGGDLEKEVARRAGVVAKHLDKATRSANSMHMLHADNGKSLGTMVSMAAKSLGKVKLFTGLVAAGVATGAAVVALSARAESKQAKEAYNQLNADLGAAVNSPFAQAVKAAQKSQKGWGKAKTGLQLVESVATDAMWIMPGGGGAAMMGAMVLPQLCNSLVPENALLGAYMALKKNEQGQLELKPSQRIELTKQLIAAMPNVASHGGIYNRLVTPIAAEIHERKLNVSQIVQLLGNDTQFTALAGEVSAKQQEAAAKAAEGKKALAEGQTTQVAAKAEAANDAKPGKIVGAAVHKGTVASTERLRA